MPPSRRRSSSPQPVASLACWCRWVSGSVVIPRCRSPRLSQPPPGPPARLTRCFDNAAGADRGRFRPDLAQTEGPAEGAVSITELKESAQVAARFDNGMRQEAKRSTPRERTHGLWGINADGTRLCLPLK